MFKDHKPLISAGAVLATGIATATLLSDNPASPCLDNRAAASVACTIEPPHLADGPENGDPEPLQAQHSPAVTASSTVVHLTARSILTAAAAMGEPALTASSAA